MSCRLILLPFFSINISYNNMPIIDKSILPAPKSSKFLLFQENKTLLVFFRNLSIAGISSDMTMDHRLHKNNNITSSVDF